MKIKRRGKISNLYSKSLFEDLKSLVHKWRHNTAFTKTSECDIKIQGLIFSDLVHNFDCENVDSNEKHKKIQ